jgi:protein CpxP
MKSKYLVGMVVLLVIVNLAAITIFFLGNHHPGPPPHPSDFLIRELGFNDAQESAYMKLVTEHRAFSESHKENIIKAKNRFFNLLQEQVVPDSTKQAALKEISKQSEEMDLMTFSHFQKVRALCTEDQKKKFDRIINQMLGMMAGPRPPGGGEGVPPPPQ